VSAGQGLPIRPNALIGNFGIQLKDGVCTALAIILASRNVLFIVASGIQQSDADEAFKQAFWISKPWKPEVFLVAVGKALEQPDQKRQRRPRGDSARGDLS